MKTNAAAVWVKVETIDHLTMLITGKLCAVANTARRARPRAIAEQSEKVPAIADRGMKRNAGKLKPILALAVLHGQSGAANRFLVKADWTVTFIGLRGTAAFRQPSPRGLAHARGAALHLPNAAGVIVAAELCGIDRCPPSLDRVAVLNA